MNPLSINIHGISITNDINNIDFSSLKKGSHVIEIDTEKETEVDIFDSKIMHDVNHYVLCDIDMEVFSFNHMSIKHRADSYYREDYKSDDSQEKIIRELEENDDEEALSKYQVLGHDFTYDNNEKNFLRLHKKKNIVIPITNISLLDERYNNDYDKNMLSTLYGEIDFWKDISIISNVNKQTRTVNVLRGTANKECDITSIEYYIGFNLKDIKIFVRVLNTIYNDALIWDTNLNFLLCSNKQEYYKFKCDSRELLKHLNDIFYHNDHKEMMDTVNNIFESILYNPIDVIKNHEDYKIRGPLENVVFQMNYQYSNLSLKRFFLPIYEDKNLKIKFYIDNYNFYRNNDIKYVEEINDYKFYIDHKQEFEISKRKARSIADTKKLQSLIDAFTGEIIEFENPTVILYEDDSAKILKNTVTCNSSIFIKLDDIWVLANRDEMEEIEERRKVLETLME